ncbi:hypothetical protein K435DRAFT_836258 [Dendrothele bispora CBS 962.96]|uniref:DUF6534 domain-containing protein n=1 Tax=Dendrothele bispora (strain CBS 962.96) TaxID=1314807 RepID=A0A4S8MIN5_DENBC|nr:hypothetical protein K435DRAFT_836258 [Dendrothele bispora CBS 962.96]
MTPEELHQAEFLLGPWLVGCYFDAFLQGILCCQFYNYVLHYWATDRKFIKLAVVGLGFLTVVRTIHCFVLMWIQQIQHFSDLQGAILLNYTAWWQTGSPLFVALIGFYVQSYYCYRLYVISNRYAVVLPLFSIFLFALISICLATYFIDQEIDKKIALWFAVHLSFVCAGDLLLAATTATFLLRSKKNVLPQHSGLITALVRLTFQTALPAAICALLNLVFSQTYSGQNNLVSTGFNTLMPKVYAISMMWTLNSRRSIRGTTTHSSTSRSHPGIQIPASMALGTGGGGGDGFTNFTTSAFQVGGGGGNGGRGQGRWRTAEGDDLEMGPIPMEGNIHITKTTIQRVDHITTFKESVSSVEGVVPEHDHDDDKTPLGLDDLIHSTQQKK